MAASTDGAACGHDPEVRYGLSVAALSVACGGQVVGTVDGGPSSQEHGQTGDASNAGAEAGMVPFNVCPSAPPTPGTSCPYSNGGTTIMVCAFNPGSSCVAYECDTTGHWRNYPQCP